MAPVSTMSTSTMNVTPEMARNWLKNQAPNRGLSEVTVQNYIHALKTGQFTLTPGGIAFDKKGRLRDGQHRLQAVLQSGISARFRVHENCSEKELEAIDLNRPRSLADQLRIMDKDSYAHIKVPVVRLALKIASGRNGKTGTSVYREVAHKFGDSLSLCEIPRAKIAAPGLLALVYAHPIYPDAVELLRDKLIERESVLTQEEHNLFRDGFHRNRNRTLETMISTLGDKIRLNGDIRSSTRRLMLGVKSFLVGESRSRLTDSEAGLDWMTEQRKKKGLPSLKEMMPGVMLQNLQTVDLTVPLKKK